MSTESEAGTGGASITPSARPSIHSHFGCRFAMTRYGLQNLQTSPPRNLRTPPRDEGKDEVDNMIRSPWSDDGFRRQMMELLNSKLRRPKSPISTKHPHNGGANKERRNSFDGYQLSGNSSSEIQKLATSLPARFSEEYDSWQRSDTSNFTPNTSGTSQNSPNTSNTQTRSRARSKSVIPECAQNESKSTGIFYLIGGIIVVLVAYISNEMFNVKQEVASGDKYYSQIQFTDDLHYLGEKYKISEDSMLQLKIGIFTISQRADSGSFVFVYDSKIRHFNAADFNNFVKEICSVTAKYLRNDSTSVDHVTIDGSKLEVDMKTPGDVIQRYSEDVDRTGVMLIKDLEKIPSSLAMAFHYYCDEYNPVAKKSAILFTLDLAKCKGLTGKPTHARIEKCLAEKWSDVPSDSMGPLLTRVVDIVIDVTRH